MAVARSVPEYPRPDIIPAAPWIGLLTTKLSAPRLRPNLVERSRLIQAISNSDSGLTLICAPAGYGKSTLATQWLIQAGIPSAWVSLDAHDDYPLKFFALVVAAIQTIDRDIAASTWQLINDADPPPTQMIVRSLVAEISATTRAFALVLDDYQAIDSPDIHAAMALLLQNLQPAMRVFIITRTEPPLLLARLRGRQELLELSQAELQFTNDEALALLQRFDQLEVTPGEVGTLNDRAEGWVTGLQLVSHDLRGHSPDRIRRFTEEFSGSVRSIENYLWEEVIARQPETVQDFLVQTSILSPFNAQLCDAVTERTDSAAMIRRLEREGLFLITLDDVGQWYRYHHLFADVLRDRLEQMVSEAELAALHRRAAAWLEERGDIEDATRHALAGRDWSRAVRLLEDIGAQLYEQDRIPALCHWLQGLPREILEQSPRLAFWLAFALGRVGRFPQSEMPLRIVERAWLEDGDSVDFASLRILQAFRSLAVDMAHARDGAHQALAHLTDDNPDEQAMALLIVGLSHLYEGNCVEAQQAFARARVKVDAGRREWVQFAEMGGSAGVLMQQGKLREAAVLFRRILKLAEGKFVLPSQQAYCRLGDIYLEWNMLEEAERTLIIGEQSCEETRAFIWRSEICLGLAMAAWARGEFELAFDEVERAIDYGNQAGLFIKVRYARAYQARFWLATGQLALARLWAESCDLDPLLPPDHARHFEHLTLIRLLIADDRPEAALTVLEALRERAEAHGRAGELIEILVLQALALKEIGEHPRAVEALSRAMALGEPNGYVRVFANETPAITPLLRHAATRGAHRDYAQRLLGVIETTAAQPSQAQTSLVETLSEREVEVLRLVSAGLPNRDIGQHLFISEKTVKKHLSHILAKLDATNRTQAVDQARRIGLL
jgi:LuxR family maltose regulon positive regulatory protein